MQQTVPGPILLLGAPGVGKGTQAKELVKTLGDSADFDRRPAALQRGPMARRLGKLAEAIMKRGELVPDALVNEMVAVRLQEPDTVRGFILDGFPAYAGAGRLAG